MIIMIFFVENMKKMMKNGKQMHGCKKWLKCIQGDYIKVTRDK